MRISRWLHCMATAAAVSLVFTSGLAPNVDAAASAQSVARPKTEARPPHLIASPGEGPCLDAPRGLAVEASGDLVVVSQGNAAVYRVDPVTGDRAIVSDAVTGVGDPFLTVEDIAVSPFGELIVLDKGLVGVFYVDPVTGDRTVLSNDTGIGAGPNFTDPQSVAVEASGDLVVTDSGTGTVLRIDPVTGDRVIVSGPATGVGPPLDNPRGIAVEASGELVVADPTGPSLLRVDPVTGDRIVVSDAGVGIGPLFTEPRAIAVEASGDLVVTDLLADAVFRVDPITGDRVVIADPGTGSGPFTYSPPGITPHILSGDLIVTTSSAELVRIDVLNDRLLTSSCVSPDIRNHDNGNMILTITDQGALGFRDDSQAQGSGLIFPKTQDNVLFIGSLWVAQDTNYVANRDYVADPKQEWVVEVDPDGHPQVEEPGANADEQIGGGFKDADSEDPFGFYIRQESWAFDSGSHNDDFVIVRYFIHNRSDSTRNDLYSGLFLDLDIDDLFTNEGGTDSTRNMVYLNGTLSDRFIGIVKLNGDGVGDSTTNMAVIPNSIYIHPEAFMPDSNKFGFLRASEPQYVRPLSAGPDDYSLLLSVGPFTLAPAESIEVTFGIVGAANLPDLKVRADRAQAKYSPLVSVAEPRARGFTLLQNAPNPFNPSTRVRFDLARAGEARVAIFDVSGRVVRTLAKRRMEAGRHELRWDGRDQAGRVAAGGLYFLQLETGHGTQTRRMILLR